MNSHFYSIKANTSISVNPTNTVVDAASKVMADYLSATLLGVIVGWYVFVNHLKIPDRLREFDDDLEYIKSRQRKVIKILGAIYREKYRLPHEYIDFEENEDANSVSNDSKE